jgi:hypothetical protein
MCGSVSVWELGWVAAGVCDATAMGGSGSWYPNSPRRSKRILVSALDLWRVGLTEHWTCAGVESLPASPPGWSVVPGSWTATTTACAGDRLYWHDDRVVDSGALQRTDALSHIAVLHPVSRPLSSSLWTAQDLEAVRGVAASTLINPPTHTAGERHIGTYALDGVG